MNNNYENLPAVLNANQLAAALGISRAGAYQLLNTGTFPNGQSHIQRLAGTFYDSFPSHRPQVSVKLLLLHR